MKVREGPYGFTGLVLKHVQTDNHDRPHRFREPIARHRSDSSPTGATMLAGARRSA